MAAPPGPAGVSPRRPDILDKSVIVITACVWSGYFLAPTLLEFIFPERAGGLGVIAARIVTALCGALLCLMLYAVLRRWGGTRPWPLLLKTIALATLPAACLALIGPFSLRAFTTFYEDHPGAWMHLETMSWNLAYLMWMFSTWSALYVGTVAILQVRRRETQLAAAREAAQEAQMMVLRMQINPHFLFNSLNTLAGMVALGSSRQSSQLIENLAQLLRQTLAHAPFDGVPLSEELGVVRRYLDIESARFPDRLMVHYDVPPDCADALVPGLTLLPLAENSIKHALAGSEGGIVIRISARREDGQLVIRLEDEGGGRPPARSREGLGIGLANLQQQLDILYGTAGRLEAGATEGGWRNVVRVPWRKQTP